MNAQTTILTIALAAICTTGYAQNNSNGSTAQTIKERQVRIFEEIPVELLNHLDQMGVDTLATLNDYEARYLSFIFSIDTNDFNLAGAKMGFIGVIGNKIKFFSDEKDWFYRGEKGGVGGCCLYIFNANQKKESGGYEAAIICWSKIAIPIEDVVKRLKQRSVDVR
ncbi:MAG: hypothetical protein J6U04_05210 [Salinivirgaceae bacterium]|nr:hypothetical protein [Salinivirgaceae bacterium]